MYIYIMLSREEREADMIFRLSKISFTDQHEFTFMATVLQCRSYIYISIYNWGPISRVQGPKAGSPQIVPGDKSDF